MGQILDDNGKRLSNEAMAVVHERYWGLPWYWPKVVFLDGRYPCDAPLFDGEEYLVAGRKGRYGVVEVNLCSRTQPLSTAQLDLRTLDGSHCSAPGGTIIGHIRGEWDKSKNEYAAPNVVSVAFGDLSGNTYISNVDENGIYEIQHLPNEFYAVKSRLDDHRYVESYEWDYRFAPLSSAPGGVCEERELRVRNYQLSGRLLPGIGKSVEVELTSVETSANPIRAASIEPDGRFYFQNVPRGEYFLFVRSTIGDTNPRIYYPGVSDTKKATRIDIDSAEPGHSYDFEPRVLPLVPVPLVLDRVAGSDRFTWDFQLLGAGRYIGSSRADRTDVGLVYGVRGASYRLQLYAYPHEPPKDDYCRSDPVTLTATAGMASVHIIARCANLDR